MVKGSLITVVPYHKAIRIGTLKAILNQIEISVDDFTKLI
jgi:hypothetical protein